MTRTVTRRFEERDDVPRDHVKFAVVDTEWGIEVSEIVTRQFIHSSYLSRHEMANFIRTKLNHKLDECIEAEKVWRAACDDYARNGYKSQLG